MEVEIKSEKPLRVLLISALFPHAGEPTLGIFVRNRLEHLIKDQNIQATVIAPVPWFPFKGKVFGAYGRAAAADRTTSWNGVEIYHPRYLVIPKVGMLLTPKFLANSILAVIEKLRAAGSEFDIVDAHYLYPDAVAVSEVARKCDLPFVATARGSDVTQIALLDRPRAMILKAAKAAAHLITVSRSLKTKLSDMGVPPEKITSIRNGIDIDKFQPDTTVAETLRKTWTGGEDRSVVLFAGWLIPRKRVDIVLSALALLPDYRGVIVGDGPLSEELETKARQLGISERVTFAGQKTPEEMPNYFGAADVMCLPSEREGWANVMLEALACGAPVVSRAVDGAMELLQETPYGELVEGSDPAGYAEAIAKVVDRRFSRQEIRDFAAGYGWGPTSAAQMRVFKNAIAQHEQKSGLGK